MKTYNASTEKKTIHLLLNNESAIELCLSAGLTADAFATERHQIIFGAIVDLYVEQTIAAGDDLDVLVSRIEYEDDEDKKQTMLALKKLQSLKLNNGKPIQMKFLQTYIKELKDLLTVRKVIRCTQRITNCINNESSTVEELLQAVDGFSDEVIESDGIVRMDMASAVDETIKEIVDDAESDNNIKFFVDELDEMAKILRGYLTYIIGAPGVGKSAVTLNMASKMSDAGVKVGYFTLEMNIPDCVKRLISIREGIYSQRMLDPKLLKSNDWKIIERVLDDKGGLKVNNIFFVGKPDISLAEFRNEIVRLVKVHDIDVVIVDYYQLIRFESDSNLPESVEIPRVSNALKTFAGQYYMNPYGKLKKIPIIALSQVVKDVERRDDKHPYMNDMYYGGAKDARLVVSLYRDEYYYPDDTTKPDVIEFGIVKQNNGVMNEWVDAHFDSLTFSIRSLTDDERSIIDDAEDDDDDYTDRKRSSKKSKSVDEESDEDYEDDD